MTRYSTCTKVKRTKDQNELESSTRKVAALRAAFAEPFQSLWMAAVAIAELEEISNISKHGTYRAMVFFLQ